MTDVETAPVAQDEAELGTEHEISPEAIARRAYEIHISAYGGSDIEDWLRAEQELRESA
ncbi:MAG TPA: hypothetical protein VJ375_01775 [Gaiellaceae bacterium]|nr:hypothetical protein [Gaiellaceae bacterium]